MINGGNLTYPIANSNHFKGKSGINTVAKIANDDLFWIFRQTHNEDDFGIDGYLDVVTDYGSVTGQQFAVQIKSGQSFFTESTPRGILFRGEGKHLKYYQNHPMPVLIVLVDCDKRVHWTVFDMNRVVLVGQSWTIIIPLSSNLSLDKQELISLLPDLSNPQEELDHFWNIHNIAKDGGLVFAPITKLEVDTQNFQEIEAFIERILQRKETIKSFQDRIEIIFDGYNDTNAELYEIESCREYIKTLLLNNPEIFFFLNKRSDWCLLRVLPIFYAFEERATAKTITTGRIYSKINPEGFLKFLESAFKGLNIVAKFLKLSKKKRIANDVALISTIAMDETLRQHLLSNYQNKSKSKRHPQSKK